MLIYLKGAGGEDSPIILQALIPEYKIPYSLKPPLELACEKSHYISLFSS